MNLQRMQEKSQPPEALLEPSQHSQLSQTSQKKSVHFASRLDDSQEMPDDKQPASRISWR